MSAYVEFKNVKKTYTMGEVKIDKKDTVIQLKGNADISVTF